MSKLVFKVEPRKLENLTTSGLLAALEVRGHGGTFIHKDTIVAIKDGNDRTHSRSSR